VSTFMEQSTIDQQAFFVKNFEEHIKKKKPKINLDYDTSETEDIIEMQKSGIVSESSEKKDLESIDIYTCDQSETDTILLEE